MSVATDERGHPDDAPAQGNGDPDTGSPLAPSLRTALRAARLEDAERSRAIADLRAAELSRLDLLKERLLPVLAQVPDDVDLFEIAVMPVPRPRLFVDMIGFVEMAHDRRTYRFIQDRRDGRITLCESDRIEVLAEAVTGYIARRLIEREKALAGVSDDASVAREVPGAPNARGLRRAGRYALEYLGLAALVVLLWVFGHAVYQWALIAHR